MSTTQSQRPSSPRRQTVIPRDELDTGAPFGPGAVVVVVLRM